MTDETECLERADRLISEGVIGDRGLIASMILEAVHHERERCCQIVYGQCGSDNVAERTARAIREKL